MDTKFAAAFDAAFSSEDAKTLLVKVAREYPAQYCTTAQQLAQKDDPAAAFLLDIALQIPNLPNTLRAGVVNDIGRIHANAGQTQRSLSFFQQAISLHPNHPGIISNIALAHRWQGNLAEAERWLKRAIKINPWESNAALELSFVRMLGGDYARGFEDYECRFRIPGGSLKKLVCDKPEWDGTNGKNVFVYGEQGSGDIFLMLRYARLIKERGLRQSWVVHKAMLPLVKSMPEIDFAFASGEAVPDFDCHIPAASLPRLFKTTINDVPNPLCFPDIKPVDYGPGFHVGIVWRGNKNQANDKIRSTNLSAWADVLAVNGATFHSLQVDGADEALAYSNIKTYELPKDWMDTAARVKGLDLVISVDTSMVHLCGSMGVDCWCALHCRPYFVFPLTNEDCPWYPSVRLFKQKKEFDWKPVFADIASKLKLLC